MGGQYKSHHDTCSFYSLKGANYPKLVDVIQEHIPSLTGDESQDDDPDE